MRQMNNENGAVTAAGGSPPSPDETVHTCDDNYTAPATGESAAAPDGIIHTCDENGTASTVRGSAAVPDAIIYTYTVDADDFARAGEASSDVKKKLKQLGVAPDAVRRVSIALYEGEINMVIHAHGGQITVEVSPEEIRMVLADRGPGIPDIAKALEPGWSTAPDEIRSLGFGAGMGLPNMKKYTDSLDIQTVLGTGTTITMTVRLL